MKRNTIVFMLLFIALTGFSQQYKTVYNPLLRNGFQYIGMTDEEKTEINSNISTVVENISSSNEDIIYEKEIDLSNSSINEFLIMMSIVKINDTIYFINDLGVSAFKLYYIYEDNGKYIYDNWQDTLTTSLWNYEVKDIWLYNSQLYKIIYDYSTDKELIVSPTDTIEFTYAGYLAINNTSKLITWEGNDWGMEPGGVVFTFDIFTQQIDTIYTSDTLIANGLYYNSAENVMQIGDSYFYYNPSTNEFKHIYTGDFAMFYLNGEIAVHTPDSALYNFNPASGVLEYNTTLNRYYQGGAVAVGNITVLCDGDSLYYTSDNVTIAKLRDELQLKDSTWPSETTLALEPLLYDGYETIINVLTQYGPMPAISLNVATLLSDNKLKDVGMLYSDTVLTTENGYIGKRVIGNICNYNIEIVSPEVFDTITRHAKTLYFVEQ